MFDDLVVLVEAKATRSRLQARAADPSAAGIYAATLGHAFGQLGITLDLLNTGAEEFSHIPTDRPIIGMVATLDPWYTANSFGRTVLPQPPLPTIVASARDIEQLVAIGQRRALSTILTDLAGDGGQHRTREMMTTLNALWRPADRNPLLSEAWSRLPVSRPATA
ncbi:hypothetical protein [Longispora urticae]